MGYWLEKGIIYYGDKWGNLGHEFCGEIFFAHELHGWTRRLCDTRMATGSVARIYTNAMGDMTTTGTTWDNLKLSFAGATEMPRNIIAHELHELTRRQCAKKNGDRVGRTNCH